MKLIWTLLLFSIFILPVHAQDSTQAKSVLIVKTDAFLPVYLLFSRYYIAGSITVERILNKRHSVQLMQLVSYPRKIVSTTPYATIQTIPAYKFYLSPKGQGFYTGAYLKSSWIFPKGSLAVQDYKYANSAALGGLVGYQMFFLEKRLVLDLLIGFGSGKIIWRKYKEDYQDKGTYRDGKWYLDGVLALNFGFNFHRKQ